MGTRRIDRRQQLLQELEAQFGAEEDESAIAQRRKFIAAITQEGGKGFVERVRRYGVTDRNEPLHLSRWFAELLEAIGDFRLHHTLTTGCAQLGKTLSHTLLLTDTISVGQLSAGWFYATRDSRNSNVPGQFYPIVGPWTERYSTETGVELSEDRQSISDYQLGSATAFFRYTSTTKPTPSRAGLATAGGSSVSFTANVLFYEERSQWLPGSADPLPRRLDYGLIPTRPIRELGTPGAGQGIEVEVERAGYWFYPHYTCSSCGKTAPLDPKGCLLKKFKRKDLSGKEVEAYLSESGRPVQWWFEDESDPVDTAMVACAHCGYPITSDQRDSAWFQCRRTGLTLRQFLDDLPETTGRYKVALHLSPLCRQTQNNLAAELIRAGLEAMRSEDWQQQALGHPSENTTNNVTLQMLKAAIAAPKPVAPPTFTLAGIDQGRSEDWLWVVDFHPPDGWQKLSVAEALEKTVRVVKFGGGVLRAAIPEKLSEMGVTYGIIDNEPDRSDASNLCAQTCLEMADQKPGLNDAVKEGKVIDGGREYACWQIRNEKFLKQVLTNFVTLAADGYQLYRLPADWEKWVGMTTERSPLRHLCGPSYDPDTGKWKRGDGNIDDLYYAAMFCEAAFYLQLIGQTKSANWVGEW